MYLGILLLLIWCIGGYYRFLFISWSVRGGKFVGFVYWFSVNNSVLIKELVVYIWMYRWLWFNFIFSRLKFFD